jgi:multidrug transporter EmrE-like cation transporter
MSKVYSAILFSCLYAVCNVSGAALIKTEIAGRNLNSFMAYVNLLFTVKVIIGFMLVFVSALILFKALSLANFSFVIPISNGVNFTLTAIAGYFIFSERLSLPSYIGMVLILSGILLMTLTTEMK